MSNSNAFGRVHAPRARDIASTQHCPAVYREHTGRAARILHAGCQKRENEQRVGEELILNLKRQHGAGRGYAAFLRLGLLSSAAINSW